RWAPVGRAFERIRDQDGELHGRLYESDGSHPSPLGSWLAALVLWKSLTLGEADLLEPPPDVPPAAFELFVEVVRELADAGRRQGPD
ncbi:MAG: hypothetical protein MI919_17135, partial [Holophagales bacterium]|nr:hypothetical protein [Holophagales bacterium]